MIRSLFSIILAVVLGLTVARFIEGMGAAAFPVIDSPDVTANSDAAIESHTISSAHQVTLLFSWGIAALIAAMVALLLARRWAPLGYLAAVTIFFNSVITMISPVAPSQLTQQAAPSSLPTESSAETSAALTNGSGQIEQRLSWWLWPGSAVVCGLGGFAAVRALRATDVFPGSTGRRGVPGTNRDKAETEKGFLS